MIANVSLLRVIILYTHTAQSEASEITNVCGVYIYLLFSVVCGGGIGG